MEGERQELCMELEQINTSLGFLLLILFSVSLSFLSLSRQRGALCLTLAGREDRAELVGDVYCIRLAASSLIVGALGYFFTLALENCRSADPCDPAAARSAFRNLLAGLLVLAAALIRLFDLNARR